MSEEGPYTVSAYLAEVNVFEAYIVVDVVGTKGRLSPWKYSYEGLGSDNLPVGEWFIGCELWVDAEDVDGAPWDGVLLGIRVANSDAIHVKLHKAQSDIAQLQHELKVLHKRYNTLERYYLKNVEVLNERFKKEDALENLPESD